MPGGCMHLGDVTITEINEDNTWNGTVKQNCMCGCVDGKSVHDLGTSEVSGYFRQVKISDTDTITAAYDPNSNTVLYADYDPVKKGMPMAAEQFMQARFLYQMTSGLAGMKFC